MVGGGVGKDVLLKLLPVRLVPTCVNLMLQTKHLLIVRVYKIHEFALKRATHI